jgi:tellurite resistance protein
MSDHPILRQCALGSADTGPDAPSPEYGRFQAPLAAATRTRKGGGMAQRCDRPSATNSERDSDHRYNRDDTVLHALVTAGAFVALADGRVEAVEREELVNFIERQRFVPSISRQGIRAAFDNRVRQLEDRDSAQVIAEALRPLAGLSLASAVIRTATQVAAADRHIHPAEVRALKLIRLVLAAEQKPGSDSSYLEMDEPDGSSDSMPFGSDSSESCLRSSGIQQWAQTTSPLAPLTLSRSHRHLP